jgi:hypothetical protein
VLPSVVGPGKPSEDDLLRAYRSISFDMGPGHEGGASTRVVAGIALSYSALTWTAVILVGKVK